MNGKRAAFTAIVLVLGGLATLAGLEGGLRVLERFRGGAPSITAFSVQMIRPGNAPGLRAELLPGYEHHEIRINQHGFRGPSFPREKPAGETRVFLVGDSVAFGAGLAEEQTIAARLQDRFRRDDPRTLVRVINAGVPSYDAADELAEVDGTLPPFSPDTYVMLLNFTDFGCTHTYSFDHRWEYDLLLRSALARNLALLVRRIGPWESKDPPDCRNRNTQAICEVLVRGEREPARWLFLNFPELTDHPTDAGRVRDYRTLTLLFSERRVFRIDLGVVLRARFGALDPLVVSTTDAHPGPAAADAIAEAIFARMGHDGYLRGEPDAAVPQPDYADPFRAISGH
jgi:hypothetical protein